MSEREKAREAAQTAVARMRGAWPAHRWTDEVAREYGMALIEEVADAEAIEAGVTRAIRKTPGKYPPSVADLVAECRPSRSLGTNNPQRGVRWEPAPPEEDDPPGTQRWRIVRDGRAA